MLYGHVVQSRDVRLSPLLKREETSYYQGCSDKRLKGLEPSTFCMANENLGAEFRCNLGKAYV